MGKTGGLASILGCALLGVSLLGPTMPHAALAQSSGGSLGQSGLVSAHHSFIFL